MGGTGPAPDWRRTGDGLAEVRRDGRDVRAAGVN